ncbi:MAG: PseG/SpsG family protein [Microbacteriaceae bacterium]
MRFAFRADGSPTMGTGHVMRCVTLAAAATAMGHEPMLFINNTEVDWLESYIAETGLPVSRVNANELNVDQFAGFEPDRVLVDSYVYSDDDIAAVSENIPTAIIVDFNTRTAPAALYIDPNLGGIAREPSTAEWAVGSDYAMIRPAILDQRDEDGSRFDPDRPHVLAFVGGSDPLGLTATVVRAVAAEVPGATITAVGGESVRAELEADPIAHRVTVVEPGQRLPQLMGDADVIVCAAGTSAWDVSAIGKPAVFLGIVDNQMVSVEQIRQHNLGPVIDARGMSAEELDRQIRAGVREILDHPTATAERVTSMTRLFDGKGAERIIDRLCRL